jgi:hypothetical protein
LLGDLALKEPEIEPPPAQVVADAAKCAGVGSWKRFLSSQGDIAKRERNGVNVGTWVTP